MRSQYERKRLGGLCGYDVDVGIKNNVYLPIEKFESCDLIRKKFKNGV